MLQRQMMAGNLEQSISDSRRPSPSSSSPSASAAAAGRSDACGSAAAGHRLSPSYNISRVAEEEPSTVASECPPLPPKSSKLSTSSAVVDGASDKSNSPPPEIPRRLSIPNYRVLQSRTLQAYSIASEIAVKPGQPPPQPQKRSAASSVSDWPPPDVAPPSDVAPRLSPRQPDVAPPLLPRKPIPPQPKRRDGVKLKPAMRDPPVVADSDASPGIQVDMVVGDLAPDKIQSEAEAKCTAVIDRGDNGSAVDGVPVDTQVNRAATVSHADNSGSVLDTVSPATPVKSIATLPAGTDLDKSGSAADCVPSEAQEKSAAAGDGDDDDDDDSEDVSAPRRPVSAMKRDIDARANGSHETQDPKPGVPARKLVIPAAFQT